MAINYLESPVAAIRSIHDVQRESLPDGLDDCFAFLVIIDKLALIRRTHIQKTAITDDSPVAIVVVRFDQLSNRNFRCLIFMMFSCE